MNLVIEQEEVAKAAPLVREAVDFFNDDETSKKSKYMVAIVVILVMCFFLFGK